MRTASPIESLESRRLLSVGTKFPIANTPGVQEGAFNIATDGTNFAAGIITDGLVGAKIFAADGTIISPTPLPSTGRFGNDNALGPGGRPLIAYGQNQYLLVWGDSGTPPTPNHDIWGTFVSPSGAINPPFPISNGNSNEEKVTGVAFDGSQFFVTYESSNAGNDKVVGRFVSLAGVVSPEILISTNFGNNGHNNVAYGSAFYCIVWVDAATETDIRGRMMSTGGTLLSEFSIRSNAFIKDDPVTVAWTGTSFIVAWSERVDAAANNWDIYEQQLSPGGTFIDGALPIATAPGEQFLPFIATDGGNTLITWTDARKDADGDAINDLGEGTFVDIYGQFISNAGQYIGGGFPIAKDANYQLGGASAFGAGTFIVGWDDGVTYLPQIGPTFFGDVVATTVTPLISINNNGGLLTIGGTIDNDNITLTLLPNFDFKIDDNMGNSTTMNVDSFTDVTVFGGAGDDTITVVDFPNVIYIDGGAGNDKITGSDGDDTLTGGAGKDTLDGGNGADLINGNGGNDSLLGDGGPDRLNGGDGNDILDGGDNADTLRTDDMDILSGGPGLDTADYSNHPLGVSISLNNQSDDGYLSPISEGDNVMDDCETVIGGAGNDQLRGSASDNLLQGGGGNDYIRAGFDDLDIIAPTSGDGNDTLEGGKGDDFFDASTAASGTKLFIGGAGADRFVPGTTDDTINGGADLDTIDYGQRTKNLDITLAAPTVESSGNGQKGENDTIIDVENALGGSKDDRITGNALPNQLDGQKGNDTLNGGGGEDVLNGGVGDDSLLGGDGNDVILNDNVPVAPNTDADFVDGGPGFDIAEFDARDQLFVELDIGKPSAGSAPFPDLDATAAPKAPVLAKNGKLTIYGTQARDIINVDVVGDKIRVRITDKLSAKKFSLAAVKRIEINALGGNDTVTAKLALVKNFAPSVVFIGGDGNDTLIGGDQADEFISGAAADGADDMTGGKGANSVLYDQRTSAVSISPDNVANDGQGNEHDNVRSDITNLFGGFGGDTITGTASAEFEFGGDGNDSLDGAAGSDKLVGGSGVDTSLSGTGVDLTVLRGDGSNDFYNLGPKKDGLGGGFYSVDTGDISI